MISDILLLKMPGSLSTLEFPLLPASFEIPEEYIVHESKDTKHTRDLNQTIKVPYFDDYDVPNMALLDGEYYWITSFRNLTLQKEIIEYELTYCAPTSRIHVGDSLKGMWERTPILMSKHMRNVVITSTMKRESTKRLNAMKARKDYYTVADGLAVEALKPYLIVGDIIYKEDTEQYLLVHSLAPDYDMEVISYKDARFFTDVFWIEITATTQFKPCTKDHVTGSSSDYPNYHNIQDASYPGSAVQSDSSMCKYGFFVRYDREGRVYRIACEPVDPATITGYSVLQYPHTMWLGGNAQPAYPSLAEAIVDADELLGFPQDSIIDISICEWCPYAFEISSKTIPNQWYYPHHALANEKDETHQLHAPMVITMMMLKGEDGSAIYPNVGMMSAPNAGYIYNGLRKYYFLGEIGQRSILNDSFDSHTISITPMEKACGQIALQDANGNIVAEIPNELFIEDANGVPKLTYKARTYSDSTGLYTKVDIGTDDCPHVITVPASKLPYVGDSWTQYRFRQQATDREALSNAKEQALMNLGVSLLGAAEGAANTFAFGLAGSNEKGLKSSRTATLVSGVGGAISGILSTTISMRAAEQEQELTEKSMKRQAGTGYNTGYGTEYCANSSLIGAGFVVLMPEGLDSNYYDAFTSYHGFPAEGELTLTAQEGYFKGRLYTDADTGVKFDALNNDLSVGFRFIEVEEPTPTPTP